MNEYSVTRRARRRPLSRAFCGRIVSAKPLSCLSLALSLACGFVVDAHAAERANAVPQDPALAQRLRVEESLSRIDRQLYTGYFRQAYARYPSIPAGTLEAVAYVTTRWQHLQPAGAGYGEQHQHMPRAYGVMGLYRGEGFADQVGEGARLLGVPAQRVMRDPASNILAAAALLDRELRADAVNAKSPVEATRAALERYAGFAPAGAGAAAKSAVQAHARASFAFDVLSAQDRGVNDRGIVVPERAVAWERAFDAPALLRLRAPFVRLDVAADKVEALGADEGGWRIDPLDETLRAPAGSRSEVAAAAEKSTDYPPALWVASPYHSARTSYDSVTIHTMQGYYAGSISWFQNNPNSVSAHYLIRSSDGQITQMVRENRAAHHVGVHNKTTLGIEHEGFIANASWYTAAMYNASAALTRHFCATYSAISCASAFKGPGGNGINVLPASVKVKGHQHYSSQTHTDPGQYWDWARYYNLLNPGTPGGGSVIDSFESSVGHFDSAPAYSGSTTGISAASLAERNCTTRKNGECSLRVLLKDDAASANAWAVRLLSGGGNPGSNAALTRAGGKVGVWVYTGASGLSAAVGIDDSDGTERSVARAIPVNTWTYLEWRLDDAAQWDAWVGGANGAITATTVKLDAVWLYRDQTSFDVNVYLDDVQVKN
ncbi:N-acetylmuramoyl-L-alanine amidase [Lysobacter enzymogenes]|uniref:N-acetylmuramoyl-L-alanine amidase n=1 Tax=Lysobacter enzymogenes TaxID=69 RepID=UPI00099DAD06|nr:peptidoglycan recognition family protein [Lysobacter enzymogenes]UZW61227.1 N-acetylmuramoyl-L-alanine amidase [Lysobacter enzymogenes]